jgi:tetratricopeptide (TPR) repeat protein
MHQGLHAPALEAYLEAGAVFEQLVEIDRRHDLAIEYTKLLSATGLALENVGKLEPAYQMFHRVLENAGSISTEPGNREWLGFISFMKDHIRGVTRLLQMTPDEVPSLCDEVRQSLANAQQIGRAGEIRAALQIYERALTIASRIVELTRAPAHLALRANVLMHQGVASMHAGRTAASEAALRGAVVDLDRAVVLSPDHAQDWARARLGLAACLRMQHDEHGVRQVLQPVLDRRSSWLDRGWKEWRTKAESFLNEPGTP